jgi:hypothetical protein
MQAAGFVLRPGAQRGGAALQAGLFEGIFGGLLLPIKEPAPLPEVPTEVSDQLDELIFPPFNENIKAAKTKEEFLASPAFGTDEEMRRPPEIKYWPGNRPPLPNFSRKGQVMDATWGRGKFRTEVWNMDINPVNRWWQKYEPSFEEIDALEAGYDFENPEAWLKAKGFDFEAAMKEYQVAYAVAEKEYLKTEEAWNKPMTQLEVLKMKNNLQRYEEQKFRYEDNLRQKKKNQPSLDVEDTGKRFRND